MKRILFAIITLTVTLCSINAQQKIYVCEGFRYHLEEVSSEDDIKFFANGTKIGITEDDAYELKDVDSITFAEPVYPRIDIKYEGNSAIVTVAPNVKGVTYTINGANVTLTSTDLTNEYLYSVSGNSNNGSLVINGEYKLTVELAGLTLTNPSGPAIDIQCGKRIGVLLKKGTVNTLADGKNGVHKAAFYIDGHPEFEGGGTLNVTGNTKHAICAKEYLQFKRSTGTVNILSAVSDGIHCGKGRQNDDNSRFIINGGVITVNNTGSDCIDADDYGSMYINGGTLNLNVSAFDAKGLKCDSIIRMTGGDVNITVTGAKSEGIRACYNAYFSGGTIDINLNAAGTEGIKGKKCTKATDTVFNGGNLTFQGTAVNVNLNAGQYTDGSWTCGIYADNVFVQSAGRIMVYNNAGVESPIFAESDVIHTGGDGNIW